MQSERGSSLAWTAVFLAAVILPLMMLVGDGARLLYVHSRISAATDAACEDLAWSINNRVSWQQRRDNDFALKQALIARAKQTFGQMLAESYAVNYLPAFSVQFDIESGRATCTGIARVPLTVVGGEVTIRTTTRTKTRYTVK